MPSAEAVASLSRIYLQTLALSVVFVGAGQLLYRALSASMKSPASLRWGLGFFLGITALYPAYVFLSRVMGAKAALLAIIVVMAALAIREVVVASREGGVIVTGAALAGSLLLLVALFSFVVVSLWVWNVSPSPDITLMDHFGSIHAGRYANYAVYIAEHDRVPYLAQNGGQSMLASMNLVLGPDRPLAALMVWLPVSLAFLALVFFGLLRAEGFGRAACAIGAIAIMFCNVAVSAIHVMVFDNGSPFAFIGYTDMAVAIATFIAFFLWLQGCLLQPARGRGHLAVPLLLGLTWAWYAPQDIVIGLAAAAATTLWAWRSAGVTSRRPAMEGLAALVIASAIGATQFGGFLPQSQREDTGFWVQDVGHELQLRPYVQFVRDHWTVQKGNEREPDVYENAFAAASAVGHDEVYRVATWIGEANLWSAVRVYGFVLLGLAALFVLRRDAGVRWRMWGCFSAAAFAVGFLIAYLPLLGGQKWWLTRFLVPGAAMALVGLAFGALSISQRLAAAPRRLALGGLALAATWGPIFELGAVSYRNLVESASTNPIGPRLELLATRKGPFIFETLLFDEAVATQVARVLFRLHGGWFELGGPGRHPGVALRTPPMPLPAGKRRAGFCLQVDGAVATGAPLVRIDLVSREGATLAARVIHHADLAAGPAGEWAWLDVDLARPIEGASIRLSSLGPTPLRVTAMRMERQ